MARSWIIDPKVWRDLVRPLGSEMIVGATLADPGVFPEGFGIGLVTTWPEPHTFVLGLNYYDDADKRDNEDIYKIDLTTFEMTPNMRGTFEREHPQYAGPYLGR